NVVISSRQSATNNFHQSLTVVAFNGAAGLGAVTGASGNSSQTSVFLAPTTVNSLIYGVGIDPEKAITRGMPIGHALLHQWIVSPANSPFWVQALTSPVVDIDMLAIVSNTSPTTDKWNLVAVEIVPR